MKIEGSVLAAALSRAAHESGRARHERSKIERFEVMERTGIPRRALLFVLSGRVERDTESVQSAAAWAESFKAGNAGGIYVFSGEVGTGKTIGAAWWACSVKAEWASASAIGLLPYAKAAQEIARLCKAPALVLDDVGSQGTTAPHAVDRIATIIRERHADMRPTLVSTNLDKRGFSEVYDGTDNVEASRLLDRIAESGEWVVVTGKSLRRSGDLPKGDAVLAARSFVACLEEVESIAQGGDGDERSVQQLRALLNLDADQVSTLVADVQASRARTESMVAGILAKTRPEQPEKKTPREQDVEDGKRREQLRRQAEGCRHVYMERLDGNLGCTLCGHVKGENRL